MVPRDRLESKVMKNNNNNNNNNNKLLLVSMSTVTATILNQAQKVGTKGSSSAPHRVEVAWLGLGTSMELRAEQALPRGWSRVSSAGNGGRPEEILMAPLRGKTDDPW